MDQQTTKNSKISTQNINETTVLNLASFLKANLVKLQPRQGWMDGQTYTQPTVQIVWTMS